MKQEFRGYYAPSSDELTSIWDTGLVVLDTNALLNLFRYSAKTRADFESVLRPIRDRLWIPHQVGLEFHKRRLDVIDEQMKAYDEITSAIKAGRESIEKALQGIRIHPSLDKAEAMSLLNEGLEPIALLLEKSRAAHAAQIVGEGENERVFDLITDLYSGRVGSGFAPDELAKLYLDGAKRYEQKVPPGFKDKDKPEPDRYGDLVLWKQLLAKVQETRQPAIFVTDDGKDDWWYRVRGKVQGPRVELIDEFFKASGERVHFYSPERFLQFAKQKLGAKVDSDAVDEVKRVSEERSFDWRALMLQNYDHLLSERRSVGNAIRNNEVELDRARFLSDVTHDLNPSSVSELETRNAELAAEIAYLSRELTALDPGGIRDSVESRLRQVHAERARLSSFLNDPFLGAEGSRAEGTREALVVERSALLERMRALDEEIAQFEGALRS